MARRSRYRRGVSGPVESPEAVVKILVAVEDTYRDAGGVIDFLERLEGANILPQPVLSPDGRLTGFRFHADGIYITSVQAGMTSRHIRAASFAPGPEDLVELGRRAVRIAPEIRSSARARLPFRGQPYLLPSRPADIPPPSEPKYPIDPEALRARIHEINAEIPSLSLSLYEGLKSGRDAWSLESGPDLAKSANLAAPGHPVVARLADLDSKSGDAALRWICRGMSPEHALCFRISQEDFYDASEKMPEEMRNLTIEIAGQDPDGPPGP